MSRIYSLLMSEAPRVFEINQDNFADSPEIHKPLTALQPRVSGPITTFRRFST